MLSFARCIGIVLAKCMTEKLFVDAALSSSKIPWLEPQPPFFYFFVSFFLSLLSSMQKMRFFEYVTRNILINA